MLLAVLGLRISPDGSRQAVGFIWSLFQAKPSILDASQTRFDVFGPDPNFGQPGLDLTGTLDTSLKLRWTSPFETKLKIDIHSFQHVVIG